MSELDNAPLMSHEKGSSAKSTYAWTPASHWFLILHLSFFRFPESHISFLSFIYPSHACLLSLSFTHSTRISYLFRFTC